MAKLVSCKDCGHGISKKAKECPNCGAVRKRSLLGRLVKYSLIGIVALFGIGVLMETNKVSNMTPDERLAYDAEREQRKAEQEVNRATKAAEKAKAEEEARLVAEAEAAEKAKAEEEARLVAEAEAAEKAKAEEEARLVAEAKAAENAKAEEEARLVAEAEAAENAKAEEEAKASAKAEKERIVNDFKSANEEPWFRTTGVVTGDYIVDVSIETNIPFDFESGLSIDLAGQDGDEIYIGTGLIRVPVTNGSATVTIDVRDHWDHSIPFPRGTYELEGYFYNQWKENIEIVELLEISEKVGKVSEITFVGSGESPEILRTHLSRSSWVMLNVNTGEPLSDRIFSNLPDLQITGRETRNASVDFVHWYSASADITIIVNSFTKEIVTWVKGRKEGD